MPFANDNVTRRFPQNEQDVSRETAWYFRLTPFQREHARRQAKFKRQHWPEVSTRDVHNIRGYSYPDRLPYDGDRKSIERVFFPGITEHVLGYLSSNNVEPGEEYFQLRNSTVLCLNLLFPLYRDHDLAAHVLRPALPGVRQVTRIELGFRGESNEKDSAPAKWLGEPHGGKRAQNRTSVAAAVWWTDGRRNRLTLIDFKYTESGYGNCPGFESCRARHRNVWIRRCTNIHSAEIARDAEHRCFMSCGETKSVARRYWEHMSDAGIRCNHIGMNAQGCVFRGPLHELMRQWLLAEYMREHPSHDETLVDVCLIHFAANRLLLAVPPWMYELGRSLPDAWRAILSHPENYRTCTVEDMMASYDSSRQPDMEEWRRYLHERYGL